MDSQEMEMVLEKIWDLHDKISDAIHTISRSHFLQSIKGFDKTSLEMTQREVEVAGGGDHGFVLLKGFRVEDDTPMEEAKSLNDIRTALEKMEDQFELFHAVQSQQQAGRDAALAQLEHCRIILANQLAEHQGNKHKVIEEALTFVSDVHATTNHSVPLKGLFKIPRSQSCNTHKDSEPVFPIQRLISNLSVAKERMKSDHLSGVLGNAALFAISLLAVVQLHQVSSRNRNPSQHLDVFSAKG